MNKKEEIFTIGDKTNNGTISKFEVDSNGIRVFFEEKPKNYHVSLNSIKHIKQPLFTTEDGVEIFEGDTVYYIETKDELELCFKVNKYIVLKYPGRFVSDKSLYSFSTKEKAEKWILMNKPLLSLQEIKDVFEKDVLLTTPKLKTIRILEKIVKQKLK